MSTFQYPSENIKTWYGTTTIQRCKKVGNSLKPIQVLGLVPCSEELTKFNCNRNTNFVMPAFAGDKNAFIFEYPTLDTTEDFRLLQYNYGSSSFQEVATLTDNTYGILYPLNSIADYPEYAGFELDWDAIYTAFGDGDYVFRANSATPLDSYIFRLRDNVDTLKDGTFKIEIDSQGLYDNPLYSSFNGERRQWDLETLLWEDSCRYYGKLYPTAFESETNYIRTNVNDNQLYYSDKFQTYDLSVRYITFNLLQRLEFYGTASNIVLTDDNEDSVSNFFENIELISSDTTNFSTAPSNREVHEVVLQLKNRHSQNFRPK